MGPVVSKQQYDKVMGYIEVRNLKIQKLRDSTLFLSPLKSINLKMRQNKSVPIQDEHSSKAC
jgi:hypothetical protein